MINNLFSAFPWLNGFIALPSLGEIFSGCLHFICFVHYIWYTICLKCHLFVYFLGNLLLALTATWMCRLILVFFFIFHCCFLDTWEQNFWLLKVQAGIKTTAKKICITVWNLCPMVYISLFPFWMHKTLSNPNIKLSFKVYSLNTVALSTASKYRK